MEKKVFDFRAAYDRLEAIGKRREELAEGLEKDKERESYTDAEKAEIRSLEREQQILDMKIKANTAFLGKVREDNVQDMNQKMREAISNGQRFEMTIARSMIKRDAFGGNTSGYAAPGLTGTNPFSITTGQIVEPLWANTILQTLGQPLLTGLKGNYQWPVVEAFEATINDEGVALGDSKIPLSKLIARPERVGIAVPITRETITHPLSALAYSHKSVVCRPEIYFFPVHF